MQQSQSLFLLLYSVVKQDYGCSFSQTCNYSQSSDKCMVHFRFWQAKACPGQTLRPCTFETSLEVRCLIMKQFSFCYQFEPQYYANCLVIFRLYSLQHMLANPTPRQVDAMFRFCFLADVFTATKLFLLLLQSTSISEGMQMRTAVLFLSLYQTNADSLSITFHSNVFCLMRHVRLQTLLFNKYTLLPVCLRLAIISQVVTTRNVPGSEPSP